MLGGLRFDRFGSKPLECRPAPVSAGRVPGIYGRKIKTRCPPRPDAPPYFFIDARDPRPPTRPPAVPGSRASMKKLRLDAPHDRMLPLGPYMAPLEPYKAQIWPIHGPPQKKPKNWPYIRTIYGHIYGLYTPDIPIYIYIYISAYYW